MSAAIARFEYAACVASLVGLRRVAVAAQVAAHDRVIARASARRDPVPHRVRLRIAVQQQERRAAAADDAMDFRARRANAPCARIRERACPRRRQLMRSTTFSRPSRPTSSRRRPTSPLRPSRTPRIPRASCRRFRAERQQFLLHVGQVDDLHDLGVEPLDDGRRRSRGREHALPRADFEARQTRTRRASARRARPASAWPSSPPSARSLPAFASGHAVVMLSNVIVTCPPITSCSAGGLPLYGMCCMSTPAIALEQLARQVLRRAVAARRERVLAGIRLHQRDQLRHVLRRHVGIDDEHVRHARDQRDRRRSPSPDRRAGPCTATR